eukprot:1149034-Pelagomonas_calceolata.AAC.2
MGQMHCGIRCMQAASCTNNCIPISVRLHAVYAQTKASVWYTACISSMLAWLTWHAIINPVHNGFPQSKRKLPFPCSSRRVFLGFHVC